MNAPLDERYFEWLYSQVADPEFKAPGLTYWSLFRHLFKTEFVWFIANDDNRMEDGRDIRHEFLAESGITDPDEDWMTIGCSMFEMLIGLSRRLIFSSETYSSMDQWFWHLLENLHIAGFNDAYLQTREQHGYVDHVLETVIFRTYQRNGQGGLFPLIKPVKDQRNVELWYQMANYLAEGHSA